MPMSGRTSIRRRRATSWASTKPRAANLDPLKRAMYVDVNTYLPEDVLALSDRIGMWHSLEIRTPLADKMLAEFAVRLPPAQLVGMHEKKIALRKAVRGWLPPSILQHPKQGFEAPTASWLRGTGRAAARAAFRVPPPSETGTTDQCRDDRAPSG